MNGYRISPYGDRDNDWLSLNSRKTQGTARHLGNRELLGIINISDKNNHFRIVSNREGIAKNEAFNQLTNRADGFILRLIVRLEKFVIDGLSWDKISKEARNKLHIDSLSESFDEDMESYVESTEKKNRRIALDLLKIIGATPETTLELDISPDILDALSNEKNEQIDAILKKFDSFNDITIGHDVKLALNKIHKEYERQKIALEEANKIASRKEKQVSTLKSVARNLTLEKKELNDIIKTQEAEVLFSRLTSGTDREQLMLLHHQSKIRAESAKGFLEQALGAINNGNSPDKIFSFIERALINTRGVIAVNNFATKASFLMKTDTLNTDIASFIEQYVQNVATENAAQNLNVQITKNFSSPFIMKFKPIEIAIIFDNLASNSTRARAKKFEINLELVSENQLIVKVGDDGPGLKNTVTPPESVFERGVTTTNGSGLGLYHVKQTIEKLNGYIKLNTEIKTGFNIILGFYK